MGNKTLTKYNLEPKEQIQHMNDEQVEHQWISSFRLKWTILKYVFSIY